MNNPMTHTMTSFTGLTLNAHRRASEAPPPCGGRLARYADAPAFSMPQRVAVPSSSSAPSSAGEKREVKECSMLCSSVAALCRLSDHGAGQGVHSARPARRPCQPHSLCPRTYASAWRPACVAAHAAPSRALPFGWEAIVDESTGTVYYHNRALGATQWDRPSL